MSNRLNFAVFIDFDNIAIGIKNTLNRSFDYRIVRDWIQEHGEIVSQVAYGNWSTHSDFKIVSRSLSQLGVKMEHLETAASRSKNGADIALSIDALELVFTQDHIDAYCILSGDSDFLPLVHKLKRYNKRVFVVAGTSFTSENLQRNCHEFVSYEVLVGQQTARPSAGRPAEPFRSEEALEPLEDAAPAVRVAIRAMQEAGEITYVNQIRTAILRFDPDFDERRFGFESFKDLIIELVNVGHFRRKMIGEHRFCIAEPELGLNLDEDSALHDGGRRRHSRSDDGSRSARRELSARPSRVRGETRAGSRPTQSPDPGKALAVMRKAIGKIESDGTRAELGLLYKTVLDVDPRFPSYGCDSREFRQDVSRFVQEGQLRFKSVGGTCAVELREARGRAPADRPVAPRQLSEGALRVMSEVLRENRTLLEAGVPAKQLERIVSTRHGFEPRGMGVEDAGELLERSVGEQLLNSRLDLGGVVRYFLPEREKSSERVSGASPGRSPRAFRVAREELQETDVRRAEAAQQVVEHGPFVAEGLESESDVDAALEVLLGALQGNPGIRDAGLSRSELRAAVREADPDFELSKFGMRSLRDLLDFARDRGYLELRDDPGEGIRYFGTSLLVGTPKNDDGGAATSGWSRMLGGLFRHEHR